MATLCFSTYARKARVTGFLVPDKGLIKVQSPREGRVLERKVVEGQLVAKHEPLFIIDVASVTTAGRTSDLVVEHLRNRATLLAEERTRLGPVQAAEALRLDETIATLTQQVADTEAELTARRDLLRLAEQAYGRNSTIAKKGYYSTAQLEKVEQDVVGTRVSIATLVRGLSVIRGDLLKAAAEKSGLADRQANDRSQLERAAAELAQQVIQIEDQRYLVIRATAAGTVTRLVANVGAAVDAATPLATIVPEGSKLEAYLYVPSSAAGFVKSGASVMLRYEAFPYQKFGLQEAVVGSVSRTSVAAREMPFPVAADEPLYLVTADIAKSTVTAFGREELLQAGSKFQADIVLENRKIWEWFIEPLLAAKASL